MSRNGINVESISSPRRVLGYAPLAVAIMLSFAQPTKAANIAVNSADATSEAGVCTIVDAVAAVNTQAAVNGCAAGDGSNDTIDLTGFTVPTTISLTQAMSATGHALVISSNVTIIGGLSGQTPLVTIQRSTVSGTPAFGLIKSSAPLDIVGVTLSNGTSGAPRRPMRLRSRPARPASPAGRGSRCNCRSPLRSGTARLASAGGSA